MSDTKKVKNKDKKIIAVADVDGVVAEFWFNASILMKKLFGIPKEPVRDVQAKDWGFEWIGLNKEDEELFWSVAAKTKNYWYDQQEVESGIVRKFAELNTDRSTLYWCTNKMDTIGGTAEMQTNLWMQKYGCSSPNVVVSKEKGYFCKSINANFFIDDKASNILDVLTNSPDTHCCFLCKPYQEKHLDEVATAGAMIISHPDEFLEMVKYAIKNLQD
jgi:hypothetical protein